MSESARTSASSPLRGRTRRGPAPSPSRAAATAPRGGPLLALRDTLGNRGFGTFVQTQLTVGRADDPYEAEADRVADHVMRMPDGSGAAPEIRPLASDSLPHLSRQEDVETDDEDEADETIDRQPEDQSAETDIEADTMVQTKREPSPGPQSVAAGTASRVRSLHGQGDPLSPSLRQYFEPRFGRDFGSVRTHTGALADDTSRALGARAYTFGSDIAFRSGAFSPQSDAGRRLLAHELTHVVQQEPGRSAPGLQMQRRKRKKKTTGRTVSFPFNVSVSSEMNSDALLQELVRQYRRLGPDADAAKEVAAGHWRWTGKAGVVKKEDVDKGYKLVTITSSSFSGQGAVGEGSDVDKDYLNRLPSDDRTRMNDEIDRRFWERTRYKPGEKLGGSDDDKKMASVWRQFRDELIQQRQALDNLSPTVKAFLYTEGAPPLRPEDYGRILRIAETLSDFSAAELADYKTKVNARTTNWTEYEDSLKRYLVERDIRQDNLEAREAIKTKLYGLDELYKKYREYQRLDLYETLATGLTVVTATTGVGNAAQRNPVREQRERLHAELNEQLPHYGFENIAEFEKYIRSYEQAFQKETAAIAFDLLAQYEHVLYEAEAKYSDPATVAALFQSLSRTQAKAHYEEASENASAAAGIRPDPEYHGYFPGEFELKQSLEAKAASARSLAESEFAGATADQPLLKNRDFPRERLARASESQPQAAPGSGTVAALSVATSMLTGGPPAAAAIMPAPKGFQSILLDYIHDRRDDIAVTRAHLTKHPERVFKLDDLLKVSYQVQEIAPGSIFDLIIRDKIGDDAITDAIWNIVVAVFAIALGILSFGTGTVAVLAAVSAFGISAYQALKEFEEYELKSAEYGAQMLSTDPSFAWVIVAVVGAGLDLAAAGSALKAMRTAVTTFNEAGAAGDLARLEKELKGLAEVSDRLRANTMKAAAAELQYRKALTSLLASSGRLNSIIVPLEELGKLVGVAYYLAKRGIIAFDKFLLELKAQKLIASIEGLSGEEMRVLKTVFEEGVEKARTGLLKYEELSPNIRRVFTAEQVEEVAEHGKLLGYSDKEIGDFLEMGAISKPGKKPPKVPLTPDEIKAQMANYANVVKPRGYPYLFESLEKFESFKSDLKGLLKKYDVPEGEVILQGSALRTPAAKDVDVAVFLSDDVFAKYAQKCRDGLLSRVGEKARANLLEQLDGQIAEGYISKLFFDRIDPSTTFGKEVYALLESTFGITTDISVMKSSSKLALTPAMKL